MYKQAMVIGKFYPPHAGHAHLVNTAAAQSGKVAVLVLGSRFESITVEERVTWLAAEFNDVDGVEIIGMRNDCPEDYHSDEIWKAQNELMRLALKSHGVTSIDAVFSSEKIRRPARRGLRGRARAGGPVPAGLSDQRHHVP